MINPITMKIAIDTTKMVNSLLGGIISGVAAYAGVTLVSILDKNAKQKAYDKAYAEGFHEGLREFQEKVEKEMNAED